MPPYLHHAHYMRIQENSATTLICQRGVKRVERLTSMRKSWSRAPAAGNGRSPTFASASPPSPMCVDVPVKIRRLASSSMRFKIPASRSGIGQTSIPRSATSAPRCMHRLQRDPQTQVNVSTSLSEAPWLGGAPPLTRIPSGSRLQPRFCAMPDAHGQLGHSMVTQAGAGLPCELQVIDLLARPEGFEPPTTWFEARYSIQLSYGREARAFYQASSGPPAGITPCRRRRSAPAGWTAPGPHSFSPCARSRPEVPSGRGCRRPREPPGPAYLPAAGGG